MRRPILFQDVNRAGGYLDIIVAGINFPIFQDYFPIRVNNKSCIEEMIGEFVYFFESGTGEVKPVLFAFFAQGAGFRSGDAQSEF